MIGYDELNEGYQSFVRHFIENVKKVRALLDDSFNTEVMPPSPSKLYNSLTMCEQYAERIQRQLHKATYDACVIDSMEQIHERFRTSKEEFLFCIKNLVVAKEQNWREELEAFEFLFKTFILMVNSMIRIYDWCDEPSCDNCLLYGDASCDSENDVRYCSSYIRSTK